MVAPTSVFISGREVSQIYDLKKKRTIQSFHSQGADFTTNAVSANGSQLFMGKSGNSSQLYELTNEMPREVINCDGKEFASCLFVSSDERGLYIGDRGGSLSYWNSETKELSSGIEIKLQNPLNAIIPSSDKNKFLYVSGKTGGVLSLDDSFLTSVAKSHPETDSTSFVRHLSLIQGVNHLCADDRFVYGGTRRGEIIQLDGKTLSVVRRWNAHERGVFALVVHEGSLFSGGRDGFVRVWDGETGNLLSEWIAHESRITDIHVGSGRQRIFTASTDKTVAIWKADGTLERRISGHFSPVFSMVVTPGEQTIITGGRDGIIRTWDALTGDVQITLNGHQGTIKDLQLHGSELISLGADNTIRIWGSQD